ncbi:hypothetical protein CIG75_14865 [Tumebacillus algifaecis]|uniref:Uncharacterized protein n=1 Tax=Tumebacillus algifaecis TaxID=1214604 RepID=A0A223D3D6_9BACL|nr:DUF3679 domain-containing protein [Tumebacillus algifaecis]ASS76112.1 hypothetical protein CIG75_14865 [Tumebacillus algifaecis]
MLKNAIEQTALYGVLLVLLALMVLFGIATAEKGVNSLVGTDDPKALAVQSTTDGEVDLKILGKHVSGTKLPWSDELSHSLEGRKSAVADTVDEVSMNIGTWMQARAKSALGKLQEWVLQ